MEGMGGGNRWKKWMIDIGEDMGERNWWWKWVEEMGERIQWWKWVKQVMEMGKSGWKNEKKEWCG